MTRVALEPKRGFNPAVSVHVRIVTLISARLYPAIPSETVYVVRTAIIIRTNSKLLLKKRTRQNTDNNQEKNADVTRRDGLSKTKAHHKHVTRTSKNTSQERHKIKRDQFTTTFTDTHHAVTVD